MQQAGALAVVAIDTSLRDAQSPPNGSRMKVLRLSVQQKRKITIPVVVISKEDGVGLLTLLKSKSDVEVRINLAGQRTCFHIK